MGEGEDGEGVGEAEDGDVGSWWREWECRIVALLCGIVQYVIGLVG